MDCKKIESGSYSCQTKWKYDVFLSFRGEDTRNNFIDHLFAALNKKGIVTFKDDVKLKKGESISSELLRAIEGSQILIVVFSKNYASSTWCLQELAKIADCAQVPGRNVLPIFYDVDPSEVRKQSGSFEKAFVEYEERFKENLEMVQRWRKALTQVANLSGWDLRDKPQYKEIENITKQVTCLLGHNLLSLPSDIVGIHPCLEELEKLLNLGSDDDVRVLGICGMGGIGKTTLATALYDRISNQFDACCIIDDVRKIYADHGPIGAQKQLLCQTLNEENLQICNISKGTNLIRTRLSRMKALIVLDNVDEAEQLEKLAMKREWLGEGSRIIIISRDEHILRVHDVDAVYQVQLLDYDNALRLFYRKAFKCDDIMQDYKDLTNEVLEYVDGLPLAIRVLGSFLLNRSVCEWKSALARLKENPQKDIMHVLRISFDALGDMEKEVFLDISCFNYSLPMEYVRNILDSRGFHPDIDLRVLIDKSLITCKEEDIGMHNLLRKLGRIIIQEKSPKEPRMWSRLWDTKDFINVMLENKDAENVEFIYLVGSTDVMETPTEVKLDGLSKMSRLKFLVQDHNLWYSGCPDHLSNELRYLEWFLYPFRCLPSSFHPEKLVELILTYSSVEQLWEGTKHLPYLRTLNLQHSKDLIKMPNFGAFPNLELLNLEGCIELVQIDPSIGILRKLIHLNLGNCESLVSIPSCIFSLSSLEELDLHGCSKLFMDPREARFLENVGMNESSTEYQSKSSIRKSLMPAFQFYYSRRRGDSVGSMLPSLTGFECCFLQHLDLSFCNLLQIPYAIGQFHFLETLYLGGNKFHTLPSSIKKLCRLRVLSLEHCKELKYLPELPSTTVFPVRSGTRFELYSRIVFPARCGTRFGVYIFDCPKLDEIESCYSIVFSWTIQLLKILIQSSVSFDRIHVVFPGTEIPRWFKIQNEGSSTHMDLSPILHDQSCIAVACCATFVIHHDPTWQYKKSRIGLILRSYLYFGFCSLDHRTKVRPILEIPIRIVEEMITSELDHQLIFLFTRRRFIDYYTRGLNLHHITLTLSSIVSPLYDMRLEVKKFGYRCICKEDLQQLNPQLMLSENVSLRKRKFLAID